MKQMALIGSVAAALTLVAAPSAFAQSEGQKLERVERDNRDIRNDTRDIRRDKADIRRDRAKLREERGERNADLRKEERAIEHGNLKAAEKWDARRRQEQREINGIKRDVHRDKVDLRKDRFDRNKDIAKRNRDASKL
jgi:hypothetical protein